MILDSSVQIDRPIREVWDFMKDQSNRSLWLKGYESSKIIEGTPVTVGAVIDHTYRERKRPFILREKVIRCDPPHRIDTTLTHPTIEFMVLTHLDSMDDGSTCVSIKSEVLFNAVSFRVLAPLMKRSFRKRQENDLLRLKKAMEDQAV